VAARDSYLGIALAVLAAAAVSFTLSAVFLKIGKQDDGDLAAATAKMEQMKGKKSSVAGALTGAGAGAGAAAAAEGSGHTGPIQRIVFACDAGMGSSAMGATVLRKKVRAAGFDDVEVTNKAISSLNDEWDVVVTQKELTDRARQRTGSAVQVSVDQFMTSPRYDEVVELVQQLNDPDAAEAGADEPAPDAAAADAPDSRPEGPEILAADSIVLSGSARDAASGIDEAGALLVAAGAVDEGYVAAMHDREATVSTFMGNGLAIPHGTNEAKSSITRSAMSFVRYPDGIDWNGNPTTFVIGIAGVGDEHLELLQKVAMTFSDPAQVERLENATTTDEILEILGDTKEGSSDEGSAFRRLQHRPRVRGPAAARGGLRGGVLRRRRGARGPAAAGGVLHGHHRRPAPHHRSGRRLPRPELRAGPGGAHRGDRLGGHRHHGRGGAHPALRRPAHRRRDRGPARRGTPAGRDGLRERDQRDGSARAGDPGELPGRGPRGQGAVRQHRGGPDRPGPGGGRGPGRHRRGLLRVGRRARPIRRARARDPGDH